MLTPLPRQPRRVTVGLSAARSDKGISMAALAIQVGVTYQTLCKIERGKRQPSQALILKLADALDVDLDRISTREPIDRAA
jgi:transcriptional regulator with XRE-family HTH domain